MNALHRPSRPHRRGVALIDAIVAAVIMGAALAVIVSLGGSALASQRLGEQIQTAAMLADEQLNLVLARGADNYTSAFLVSGDCDEPFQGYKFKLDFSGGSESAPYTVKVTISWDAATGPRDIVVETRIAPRPNADTTGLDRQPIDPVQRGVPLETAPAGTGTGGTP
ncbi:MAG: type IV pilus modification PilV family protein [Phycisphaerales bacterium]